MSRVNGEFCLFFGVVVCFLLSIVVCYCDGKVVCYIGMVMRGKCMWVYTVGRKFFCKNTVVNKSCVLCMVLCF
jgi:hypothetical protein